MLGPAAGGVRGVLLGGVRTMSHIGSWRGEIMTVQPTAANPPLALALAYHRAWASKNVDEALRHVSDDIVCDAPGATIRGMDQYRPFLANFVPIVTGYDMLAALGDAETAVLVYDLHTIPVSSGLVCECFTVKDNRITTNRLILDPTPYAAAGQLPS